MKKNAKITEHIVKKKENEPAGAYGRLLGRDGFKL